ncbi:hypothetical protein CYMTET_54514 [Cymbomonas tetramitiformis]|uniref:Uncharacterized protein n=1 Tax=Cymbomonas tetramitiformis TaxID=36881 RepID=A0AAE0BGK3_9CHLO|nr:hypothetical protein CYMTET_54514 [Cymbomonas tetramitiformis]
MSEIIVHVFNGGVEDVTVASLLVSDVTALSITDSADMIKSAMMDKFGLDVLSRLSTSSIDTACSVSPYGVRDAVLDNFQSHTLWLHPSASDMLDRTRRGHAFIARPGQVRRNVGVKRKSEEPVTLAQNRAMRGTDQTTMRTDTTGKMIPLSDPRLSPRSKGLVVGAVSACLDQAPLATFTRNRIYCKISQKSTERKKYLNKLSAEGKPIPDMVPFNFDHVPMDLTGEVSPNDSNPAVQPGAREPDNNPVAGPTSRADVRRHGVGRQVVVPERNITVNNSAVQTGACESNPTASNPAARPGASAGRGALQSRRTAAIEPVLSEYELQRQQNIVRNKSRLDAHLEVVRAALEDLDQTSKPDVDQTSEPPVEQTSEPPVEQTSIPPSDSPVLQTSDPPTQHEFTIHLTDPDEVVAAFTAPARTGKNATTVGDYCSRPKSIPLPNVVSEHDARLQPTATAAALEASTVTLVSQFRRLPGGKAVKGMTALKNMISKCDYHSYGQVIVIGDFVPGKQLRIDVGKSILDILPSEECEQERWRVAVAAVHELEVEAEDGERRGTGTYEFVLDSHPAHHDHGYLLMSSEQLATLDVKLVPSLQLNQQWQVVNRHGALVPEGEALDADTYPSVELPEETA